MEKTNNKSRAGLFDRLSEKSVARESLQEAAQLALQVEFTTIPAYLHAMYSISDASSVVYAATRSVVMEEMFHLNQAANIVVGLGALPRFTGDAVPKYPTYLPQANPATTPNIGLFRATTEVYAGVFSQIERPAEYGAPAQGDNYDSIAQLYAALSDAIKRYPGNPFCEDGPGRQRTDTYLGKFGGNLVYVRCKETAQQAIDEIVKQGEGSVPPLAPLVPVERFGTYNHYGQRTDGTYGPILGTPYELSHFMKFDKIARARADFPETLPIVASPEASEIQNADARYSVQTFDIAYSVMLQALEQAFTKGKVVAKDPYFGTVFSCMRDILPNLARVVMNQSLYDAGSASVGPNAAPRWHYHADATPQSLVKALDELTLRLGPTGPNSMYQGQKVPPLVQALAAARHIAQ